MEVHWALSLSTDLFGILVEVAVIVLVWVLLEVSFEWWAFLSLDEGLISSLGVLVGEVSSFWVDEEEVVFDLG